jgi:formate hydrogenlyase subunit 6/NADH:ubiquinone oxidoreductase subunit I
MKVCVGNGLHPAGLEDGPLGLWAPVLRPRLGYCEYECTLCGQVCPTGAIRPLAREEKERTVIGIAWIDPGRCLPIAYAMACIVCEEQCPTSPKAIVLEDVVTRTPGGAARTVQRPAIDPRRCVGCGICEYRCPLDGDAAVRVFAAGRTGEGSAFDLGGPSA